MYSELSLYYLNQIGIVPWIIKEDSSAPVSSNIRLVVLTKTSYSTKANILMKRMLAFINLEEKDLLITDSVHQLKNKATLAVLVLGDQEQDVLKKMNLSVPVLSCFDPDYLIEHPAEKKKVFKALCYLKELLLSTTPGGPSSQAPLDDVGPVIPR